MNINSQLQAEIQSTMHGDLQHLLLGFRFLLLCATLHAFSQSCNSLSMPIMLLPPAIHDLTLRAKSSLLTFGEIFFYGTQNQTLICYKMYKKGL